MRTQRGFNLIELMVVLTIAGILLGIGIPSFRGFTASQRVKNTAFDFAAALLLARSEAVKRNAPVSVAQLAANWQGWTVSVGGTTLATKEAPPAGQVTIAPNDPAITDFTYQGSGRVGTAMRFQFSAAQTPTVRCVTIGVSGVPNTTTTSCP